MGMMVAGEDQVHARRGHRPERAPRAAQGGLDLARVLAGQRHQRMMGDEDPRRAGWGGREAVADRADLHPRQPPVLDGEPMRRGEAEHGQLGVAIPGGPAPGDEAGIAPERPEQALQGLVHRHVVVAGDDQQAQPLRLQPLEKQGRLGELRRAGPLGDVARDDDEVGPDRRKRGMEMRHHGRLVGAEMQVGNLGDGAHDVGSTGGGYASSSPSLSWGGGPLAAGEWWRGRRSVSAFADSPHHAARGPPPRASSGRI